MGKNRGVWVLVPLVFMGAIGWYVLPSLWFAITPLTTANQPEVTTILTIKKGALGHTIALELEQKGIIQSASKMIRLGTWLGKWKKVKTGEYKVSSHQTPLAIFQVLQSGVSLFHPITIHEGDNIYQIAQQIKDVGLVVSAEFLNLVQNATFIKNIGPTFVEASLSGNLEGYLFPDTYYLNSIQSAEQIVLMMVKRFQENWKDTFSERAKALGYSQHQIVTLASMIEKETGVAEERPLISSVFHNRLNSHMKLQSDPTTIYGIWNRYTGNLTQKDLQTPSDFNTYTLRGLPKGPIGNPGIESLKAALYPQESHYFFFVSKNDGTHQFTENFSAHKNAVKTFQMDPRAREGKSWRNRLKK